MQYVPSRIRWHAVKDGLPEGQNLFVWLVNVGRSKEVFLGVFHGQFHDMEGTPVEVSHYYPATEEQPLPPQTLTSETDNKPGSPSKY